MTNKKILDNALDLLDNVNIEEIETIQINNTKYDDGSKALTIEITYPSEEDDDTANEDVSGPFKAECSI